MSNIQDTSPASHLFAIAPTDSSDNLAHFTRGIYVGGAGNVTVIAANSRSGTPVTFVGVPAGSILPVKARRVMATGTTATNLVGLA